MNPTRDTDAAVDPQVHAYLSALPTPDAGGDLFQRIEGTRRRRQGRRRLLAGSVALLAFSAVLLTRPMAPEPAEALAIQPAPAAQATGAELRAIDRQLQAAYDRGADAAQLAALWRARELAVNRETQENEDETIISL